MTFMEEVVVVGGECMHVCLGRGATHLRMTTLPIAVAVMLPLSSMIMLATTLSSKNKPCGSFLATAYHVPAY